MAMVLTLNNDISFVFFRISQSQSYVSVPFIRLVVVDNLIIYTRGCGGKPENETGSLWINTSVSRKKIEKKPC
jgi:hypothetical protein